jgi:hypothetical protein
MIMRRLLRQSCIQDPKNNYARVYINDTISVVFFYYYAIFYITYLNLT